MEPPEVREDRNPRCDQGVHERSPVTDPAELLVPDGSGDDGHASIERVRMAADDVWLGMSPSGGGGWGGGSGVGEGRTPGEGQDDGVVNREGGLRRNVAG